MKILQKKAPCQYAQDGRVWWNFDSQLSGNAGQRAVIEIDGNDSELLEKLLEKGAVILPDGDRVPGLYEH